MVLRQPELRGPRWHWQPLTGTGTGPLLAPVATGGPGLLEKPACTKRQTQGHGASLSAPPALSHQPTGNFNGASQAGAGNEPPTWAASTDTPDWVVTGNRPPLAGARLEGLELLAASPGQRHVVYMLCGAERHVTQQHEAPSPAVRSGAAGRGRCTLRMLATSPSPAEWLPSAGEESAPAFPRKLPCRFGNGSLGCVHAHMRKRIRAITA